MPEHHIGPYTLHTFRFDCQLGCGEIPFSRSADETELAAIRRHYQSPIHHEHHISIMGEPCFCGIDGYIEPLFPPAYRRRMSDSYLRQAKAAQEQGYLTPLPEPVMLEEDDEGSFTWCNHNAPWDSLPEESKEAIRAVMKAAGKLLREDKGNDQDLA